MGSVCNDSFRMNLKCVKICRSSRADSLMTHEGSRLLQRSRTSHSTPMHPPLAAHKHPGTSSLRDGKLTSDCDNIIEIFEQCHDDHPLMKFMGSCNDLKRQLTLCLRAEVHLVINRAKL